MSWLSESSTARYIPSRCVQVAQKAFCAPAHTLPYSACEWWRKAYSNLLSPRGRLMANLNANSSHVGDWDHLRPGGWT